MSYLTQKVRTREWTTDSTRKLLKSRVYLGESWMWVQENGKRSRKVNEHAHEPLTTLEDWTAAQSMPRGRRKNLDYPLTGVARCMECGEPLHGQLQTVPSGKTYRRYRCSNRACGGGSSILASALEEYVRGWLARALSERKIRELFTPGGLEDARDALDRAKAERTAYVSKMSAADPDFVTGLELRDQKLAKAQAVYDTAAEQAARVDRLPAADQLGDPEQFQRALGAMVDHVEVRRGRGTVDERATVVWRLHHEDVTRALAA
jgi:hypothetical protein